MTQHQHIRRGGNLHRGLRAAALWAIVAVGVGGVALPAAAEGEVGRPTEQSWSFGGFFGTYDRGALQRGFLVYKDVCASCHSLNLLSYRNLGQEGGPEFSESQVKAIAAENSVQDGPDAEGEMFERPAKPSDRFVAPFANDNEARSVNNGAFPPDFSVIAKARKYHRGFPWWIIDLFTGYQEQGTDYIFALLNGYEEPPEHVTVQDGLSFNKYFPGQQIAMAPPLDDDAVEYTDGTPATVQQMSRDVVTFLMWAAEPHLEARKRMGFQVLIFLIVLAGLMFLVKKKIWSRVEH
ncbi:MAG: cytochrome c1 [Alphaproteobacteria bacterium]